MTPLHLQILIHAFSRADRMENWDAPAVQDYAAQLVGMGAIEVAESLSDGTHEVPRMWRTTERGRAWLDLILETPMPVCRWVDPREASFAPKVVHLGPLPDGGSYAVLEGD